MKLTREEKRSSSGWRPDINTLLTSGSIFVLPVNSVAANKRKGKINARQQSGQVFFLYILTRLVTVVSNQDQVCVWVSYFACFISLNRQCPVSLAPVYCFVRFSRTGTPNS